MKGIQGVIGNYNNNKDKHIEWDRKHYQSHIEQEKAYSSLRIECSACKVMISKTTRQNTNELNPTFII